MSSDRKLGFTLIEVMAAVLVLGLLYTVLAGAAMRGLRSEGIDRRRADAEMVADREITMIETDLAAGIELEDGLAEREEEPFKISSNVEPFDVLALLPAPVQSEIARDSDRNAPSVLHDERGQSRMRRISVVVEWDEAGEPEIVERTTFAFDPAVVAQYFQSPEDEFADSGDPKIEQEKVRKMLNSPDLKAMLQQEEAAAPDSDSRTGRSGRSGRSGGSR
jgi:prepilin-type N-terminal cleavage/methylation domain-containing protein